MDNSKLSSLGRMIERARRDKRLTAKQLAEIAGISSSDLNSVESGENWPSEAVWEKLSEKLGMPVDMMADMKKARAPSAVIEKPSSSQKMTTKMPSNVIDFTAHKQKKWQQMSLFEKD